MLFCARVPTLWRLPLTRYRTSSNQTAGVPRKAAFGIMDAICAQPLVKGHLEDVEMECVVPAATKGKQFYN